MSLRNSGVIEDEHIADTSDQPPGPAHETARARRRVALIALNSGYPLSALALWLGAAYGRWTQSALVVAMGMILGFFGWFSLQGMKSEEQDAAAAKGVRGLEARTAKSIGLLNGRYGAIIISLASCVAFSWKAGWTYPASYAVWMGLVCVAIFVASEFG